MGKDRRRNYMYFMCESRNSFYECRNGVVLTRQAVDTCTLLRNRNASWCFVFLETPSHFQKQQWDDLWASSSIILSHTKEQQKLDLVMPPLPL